MLTMACGMRAHRHSACFAHEAPDVSLLLGQLLAQTAAVLRGHLGFLHALQAQLCQARKGLLLNSLLSMFAFQCLCRMAV